MTASDIATLGTTLTVWAHPDDETYLCGGLVAALAEGGHRVVTVTATRGEAGGQDQSPDGRAALARLRTRELEEALAVLGATEHIWLDYGDGECADVDPETAATRLVALLDDVRPDTVLTFGPDGFTGHPDHRAVSRWVHLAAGASTHPVRLLHAVATREDWADPQLAEDFGVYELGEPRWCDPEELVVRLRLEGSALDRKVTALLRQESQTRRLVDAIGVDRFAAWVATECFAEPA